jgi:hypothetical protein
MNNKKIKCVVSVVDSNGSPDFHFVIVECTEEQYNNDEHYDAAKNDAADIGYEPYLAYDEFDNAGKAMLSLFNWETANTISI